MDIISLLLQVSLSDANATGRITRLMYNALLNHPRLKEYWTALTEEGLLVYDEATQSFKATEKGLIPPEVFSEIDNYQDRNDKTRRSRSQISKGRLVSMI